MSNHECYIGIDNGVSGSVGIISPTKKEFFATPTFSEQDYVKKKTNITRVNCIYLMEVFEAYKDFTTMVVLERPMVNPTRFAATKSALRALEATLIAIEVYDFSVMYIDSKEWQSVMLPKGTKGTPDLKKASRDIGCRLFPEFKSQILKTKKSDADGILICEWARRKNL